MRRRCTRARSGGELFPPKKEEVTGDRFPSRQRVLFKSRVGASVERGDCLGGRGRFGDIFFLLFLPISPSLSIAVQESKEECKGQLGLNTLFSLFSLSLYPCLEWIEKFHLYIYSESRFVLFHCNTRRETSDNGKRQKPDAPRASVTNKKRCGRKVRSNMQLLAGRSELLTTFWTREVEGGKLPSAHPGERQQNDIFKKKKYLTDANL